MHMVKEDVKAQERWVYVWRFILVFHVKGMVATYSRRVEANDTERGFVTRQFSQLPA